MINDKDAWLIAKYLVRWAESEIATRSMLSNGNENEHRHDNAERKPNPRRNHNCQQD
jgi:hypothetical protein